MLSASVLIWGIIFGTIGSGFFIYGKKRSEIVPLVSGTVLFFIPYFISNIVMLIIIGAIFVFLPFFFKL